MKTNKISIYRFFILLLANLVTACTLPIIPEPTPNTAIIVLYAQPGRSLMAESLDRKRANDGRYFQVTEGRHRLTVLFQYDSAEIAGPFWRNSGNITCIMSFYYDFEANTMYRLEARPMINNGQLLLAKGDKTTLLDLSSVEASCGPY